MPIEIIKSRCDKREYKYIKLPNEMRCILISDPEADKSAASLDVKVGCSLDPKPLFGTAHFLEHMLFQGTEKYPSENEYSEFMSKNGGSNNAYTSLTNTNYHFNCSNEAFEEGLDRMAQFFICPSFSESSAEREVNAVDSEFKMALQHDGWHFFNLTQRLSNKDSLFNRFNCGNLKSLSQPGIRESLLQFHKQWYSSNIMTLTISSRHSLDNLEKWTSEKFSPVVNNNVQIPDLGNPPVFTEDSLCKLVKYIPVKEDHVLSIVWILPYFGKDIKKQPLSYFSHLFGHEGENSILSYLKSEGLALSLSAGPDHELFSFSNLDVSIELTQLGLENTEKVVEAVFQYAQVLKNAGPQDWVFNELNDLGKMKFEFQDKGNPMNYCSGLSSKMQILDDSNIDQILRHQYIKDDFDHNQIQSISESLCKSENVIIFIKSKSFEGQTTETEEWFSTKYSVENINEQLLNKINQPNVQFKKNIKIDLPPKNNLIAKNFDVLQKNEEFSCCPKLIKQWEDTDLWYMKDDKFERPKAHVSVKIYTNDNEFGLNPKKRVFANVWKNAQDEYLREFKYMADCANLDFSVSLGYDSLNFGWSGFNDSMPSYISESIQKLTQIKSSNLLEIFNEVKEKLLQEWKNAYLEQSFRQIMPIFETVIYNTGIERKYLRQILETYSFQEFQDDLKKWLVSGTFVWFVNGNYEKEKAIELVENVRQSFGLKKYKISELATVQPLQLKEGECIVVEQLLDDEKNQNSCILAYYQAGINQEDEIKFNIVNELVAHYFEEPFFDELRTKQQLGYVVAARASDHRGCQGIWFLIQSPNKGCEYLTSAINKWILERREIIKNISDEEFNQQKKSIHTIFAEKDTNLSKVNSRFWGEISNHSYDFDRQEKQLKIIEEITKNDFINHFEEVFFSKNSKRFDLQLSSKSHSEEQILQAEQNKEDLIFKEHLKRLKFEGTIQDFKSQSSFFPDLVKTRFATFRQQKSE